MERSIPTLILHTFFWITVDDVQKYLFHDIFLIAYLPYLKYTWYLFQKPNKVEKCTNRPWALEYRIFIFNLFILYLGGCR